MSTPSSHWPSIDEARAILQSSDSGKAILERLEQVPKSDAEPESNSKQKDYRTLPYLNAATISSYTLTDIKEKDAELIRPILDDSVQHMMRDKEITRYTLSDAARANVFAAWSDTPELKSALKSASKRENPEGGGADVEAQWFARLATNETKISAFWSELDNLSLQEMTNAARAAQKALAINKEIEPLEQEMRRRLALEEIIGALRMLIGTRSPIGQGGFDDDFVGREEHLETLYAHVGVVPPVTLMRQITRVGKQLTHAILGRPRGALVLHAIGGMGKSSLIAKFVMAHVGCSDGSMPIVYLDFDRATLLAADAAALLAEMVRQVALQVLENSSISLKSGTTTALVALNLLSDDMLKQQLIGEIRYIGEYVERFIEIVDQIFPVDRPFLLVLDTLERLQSLGFMDRVVKLTAELGSWPRLRVVASGRVDAVELREPKSGPAPIELELLSIADSTKLSLKLLSSACIDVSHLPLVAEAIAESSRGYPLTVRLIVDLIAFSKPEKRQEIIADISSSKEVGAARVATVLYKRFAERINVVGGTQIVKVAVCLRRLNPALLSYVLATISEKEFSDSSSEIYDALRRDKTLWAENGSGKLRWRPELRILLLDCVRAEDPILLNNVAHAALAWAKNQGSRAAAECLYYSLLAGKGLEESDQYWQLSQDVQIRTTLAGASEDFPITSCERLYLALRASARLPGLTEYSQLPARVAWRISFDADDSLALHGGKFIEPRIAILQKIDPSEFTTDVMSRSEYFGTIVKTGAWLTTEKLTIDRSMIDNPIFNEAFIYLSPRKMQGVDKKLIISCLDKAPYESRTFGKGDGLIQRLVATRSMDDFRWHVYDRQISVLHTKFLQRTEESVLLAGSFGEAATYWVSECFIEGGALQSLAKAQFQIIQKFLIQDKADYDFAYQFDKIAGARNGWDSRNDFTQNSFFTDSTMADTTYEPDTINMAVKAIKILRYNLDHEHFVTFIHDFCGVRDPDWTEPFGYALNRLYGEPNGLRDFQTNLLRELAFKGALSERHAELCMSPSIIIDPIAVLSALDEAGALPVFIQSVVNKIMKRNSNWLFISIHWLLSWGQPILLVVQNFADKIMKINFSWLFGGAQALLESKILRNIDFTTDLAEKEFLSLSSDYKYWRAMKKHIAELR